VTWLHIPEYSNPKPQPSENLMIRKYLRNPINHCTEVLLILEAASSIIHIYVLTALRTIFSTEVNLLDQAI
jgi:hypothetical protein